MFNFKPHRLRYRKDFQQLTSPDTDGAEYLYGRQTRRLKPLNLKQCYPQKTTAIATLKAKTTSKPKKTSKRKLKIKTKTKGNQKVRYLKLKELFKFQNQSKKINLNFK